MSNAVRCTHLVFNCNDFRFEFHSCQGLLYGHPKSSCAVLGMLVYFPYLISSCSIILAQSTELRVFQFLNKRCPRPQSATRTYASVMPIHAYAIEAQRAAAEVLVLSLASPVIVWYWFAPVFPVAG